MLSSRERLMATLRGEPVDRPAVNFYEVGGFRVDPDNPDPYNIYNAPDWRPLLELAETRTDLIRMTNPVRPRSHESFRTDSSPELARLFREERIEEDHIRISKTTLTVGGRTMTRTIKRERDIDTNWTVEHLLKDEADVKAYLELPDDVFAERIDTAPLEAEEARLGDAGIVMVDTEDPLCAVADLLGMEHYTVLGLTDPALFHRLLEQAARRIHHRTETVSRLFPGHLWRIYGPEYATAPFLPPHLFEEYVVRYDEPMVRMIQAHGGFARIHCHGRLLGVLDLIAGMRPDGLDPIEPPPQGDVELHEVRRRCGRDLVLFGNIEIADLETLAPDRFEEKVKRALAEGTAGEGRGFVLMPSASPYGRTLSPVTLANYETMVRLAESW